MGRCTQNKLIGCQACLRASRDTLNMTLRLLHRQVYLNKLTGQLPPVAPNCPLCVRRQNTSDGFGSGVTVQPMRAGYGARLSQSIV